MMKIDPLKRITIDEVLRHELFTLNNFILKKTIILEHNQKQN